ncbi:MAG TPA: hypothetical protein VFQ85_12480 [Mycobacteriales bacterium]|jgi:hypothetical protein|nr:hypothetical protein [Mycobacteriales bacterium]
MSEHVLVPPPVAQGTRRAGRGPVPVLVALLALLVVAFVLCLSYAFRPSGVAGPRLSLNEVYALAEQGRITRAELKEVDDEVVAGYSFYKDPVDRGPAG